MISIRFLCIGAIAAAALAAAPVCAEQSPRALPAPRFDETAQAGGLETAVLSGGCFWGMQGVFEHVKGVHQVLSGYAGGQPGTAHYEMVSTGTTGNAETVKILFDPREITYGELLRIYFSVAHDPTELNFQGPDRGTQYRSDIWTTNDLQKHVAVAYIQQLGAQHAFGAPIVTRVDAFRGFYPAEAYHQDYLIHNPDAPYIVFNDLPKIAALKRLYPTYYREVPVTVGP